jgi:hypothetical protein
MWTGELYGFYTEKSIDMVFNQIKEYAISIGYEFEYSRYEEDENLFFYKNKEMYDYHLEHGYNTDMGDEGCFSIEAKITKIDGIATLIKFKGCPNFDPFDINLVFNNVFYYILVVPFLINNSPFSKNIYDVFHKILLKSD